MTHAFPTRRASDLSSLHKSIQGRGRHFVDLRQLFGIGYYALTQRYSAPRYFHFAYLTFLLSSRSEEHTSELQSLMRISYAVFCLKTTTAPTHQRRHRDRKSNRQNSTPNRAN